MIRRPAEKGTFLLITQHDHALAAGALGQHIGNSRFAAPAPREEVLRGISLHDCGWPLHDNLPTLNRENLPLHVFESPLSLVTQVWNASVVGAREQGDYPGLLVSLHVLHLSSMFAPNNPTRSEIFEMNKFQHRQIEIQEELRGHLELSNEIPRHLGLARFGASTADDQLQFNFRMLTAMDRISLALCCGKHLFPTFDDVPARAGELPTTIQVTMPTPKVMTLDPWPFDQPTLTFDVPARRVSSTPFNDLDAFRAAYAAATLEPLTLTVRAR